MFMTRSLFSVVGLLTLTSFASAGDQPTIEERLSKLAETLEAAREEAHIPGMSIAVVKDDEIIFARGFGLADIAGERPADEDTIYAVGSTTKAFTALLTGMLVDEGKLRWDDPVTEFLPYFDLQIRSEDPGAQCTLRDLLSHRHGFARMSILWFGGQTSREEILRTASGAEPWDDFRAGFHYCNVTYLAAGEAAGVAAERTWDEMMVERIFEPLEMTSSSLEVSALVGNPRLAVGYEWNETDQGHEEEPVIDLHAIGPAGSINSNVLDMAQWIRLQLGKGEVDGLRLITAERLQDAWAPQIAIAEGMSYGLGWMLQERHGRRVVEHGGNIGGFSAQVGLMPEEDLGYVLLMNLNVTPLQQGSLAIVFDALLEDWLDEALASATDEIDYQEYAGIYPANFATFRDEQFEILVKESGLALDIPSQQVFDLKAPTDEGNWGFALTDQISVSFQRNERGDVAGLTIHQGGFHFEVARMGVALEPEVAAEELEKYLGTYVRAEGGKRVELSIVQGRLTMEDKGNLLAFDTPDGEGHASLRARDDFGATFKMDAEGTVESFVFAGESGDKLFTRLSGASETELPTLADVLALRKTPERIAALKVAGDTQVSGKVWVAQAGVSGTVTISFATDGRYVNHMDFGKFGRIDIAAAGGEAWSYNSLMGFETLQGEELQQAILGHPDAVDGDWNDYYDTVQVLRNDTLDERPTHVVRLTRGDLPSRTYWVDAENGDVLRVKAIAIEGPVRIPVTTTYSELKEIDGIRRAMRVETENPASGRIVLTFEDVRTKLELGDEVFELKDREMGAGSSD